MSAEQVERELARLRMNEDGSLGLRASVLNLMVVTDEESASSITRVISELSGRHPSRAILMISDPGEEEANLEIGLSAFCGVRREIPGGGSNQVCAEQITVHVEGPPAEHLESFAGPLLIPDLPVFLWYPNGEIPRSPECDGMVALADRLILDSGAAEDCETFLCDVAKLFGEGAPAVGDLQWTALSPWRSLVADLFAPAKRASELARIRQVEILHKPEGECRALLFAGWFASALGWRPESSARAQGDRVFGFAGPSGEVTVALSPGSPDARLRRVRLRSDGYSYQVSRQRELSAVCSTVMRGDELCAERTVRLGVFDPSVLVGEELHYRGRDGVYEAALCTVVEMLTL